MHKTVVITGTTSGIGRQTAVALARDGFTVYMLVRDINKGEKEVRNILVQSLNSKVHIVECDLTSLASVRKAADELKSKLTKIDILINNAGGIFPKRHISVDGFEMTFALNHLGPFLLTLCLMPLLEKGKARVINVSSEAHRIAKYNFDNLQLETRYRSMKAYANSKLFNIFFTQSLAEKFAGKGITAYSLHPGIVDTKFGSGSTGFFKFLLDAVRPKMVSATQGAETSVYLATQVGIEPLSGQYFKKSAPAKLSASAQNPSKRQTLWEMSEKMVEKHL